MNRLFSSLVVLGCFMVTASTSVFSPFQAWEPFEADESAEKNLTPDQIGKCSAAASRSPWKFFRSTYSSDGLKISSIIGLPPNFDAKKKYPLLVFNRGGNRSFGQLDICSLKMLSDFASVLGEAVLVASQYRGSIGSEGEDEFGGRDRRDIASLVSWSEGLEFVDHENRFMVGWSRGGMMAYLALKEGIHFNAAAIIAGPADLLSSEERRPEMKQLHSELIPRYGQEREAVLAERSALHWVDKINAPVLLVHGDADWRVSVQDSLRMAEELKKRRKLHRLVIYPGDGHGLTKSYDRMLTELRSWFAAYRSRPTRSGR